MICSGCRNLLLWIFIFVCISASALFGASTISSSNSTFYGNIRCFLTAESALASSSQESVSDKKIKEKPTTLIKKDEEEESDAMTRQTTTRLRSKDEARGRMLMVRSTGPGSSPPRCTSKCGRCKPCKPVHVAVPPGTPVTAEYYPEAWRCKCGNRLFIP